MIIKKRFTLLIAALLAANIGVASAQNTFPIAPEAQTKLIEVLKSDAAFKDKQDACRALALGGTKDAIPALAPLLSDEKLSHMARYALEQIPDPAAKDTLRAALGTAKGLPLVGVISSVGSLRDTAAIPTLTKLLSDPDIEVANAAAVSLGRIGTSASGKALMAALAKPTPSIYDGVMRCAESLPPAEAATLYDAIRKPPAPQPLRMAALRGAILARQDKGLPLLVETLRGNDYALALAAIHTARQLPGAAASKGLAAELESGKLAVDRQLLLVQVLGDRKDKVAGPSLLAFAKKSEGELRAAAIKSIVQVGDASAIPYLAELSAASEDDVSKAARVGLVSFAGREAEAPIVKMLQSPNAKMRLVGVDVIQQRRMTGAIPQLLASAKDADAAVANASLRAIGEIGSNTEASALVKILTDGVSTQAAEGALSAIFVRNRDASMADAVAAALPNAATPTKISLLRVLRRVGGPKALAQTRTAMADPEKDVRDNAIRNLYDWPTPDALPDLMAIAKNPPASANKVLALRGALRLIPQQEAANEQKLASVKEALALVERPEEKRLALTALGGIPTAESLAMVLQNLDNADLKEEASSAAVTIGEQLVKTQPAIVAEAMTQVVKTTGDQKLAKRAQALGGQK